MAAPRGRGLRPGGVVRALGRLVLLICVGFALGLVFGVVTEEPELLADHLRGQSESVVLEAATDPAETTQEDSALGTRADLGSESGAEPVASPPLQKPQRLATKVAAEREAAYAAASEQVRRIAVAAESPQVSRRLPAVASPPSPPAKRETPVAAAIAVPDSARVKGAGEGQWAIQIGAFSEREAASQLADGLRNQYPVVVLPASPKGGRWRVRIQPIAGEERAREMAERLKREERLPTWVTKVEGRSGS